MFTQLSLPKQLESTTKIRFQDCDPFRHLNNARYTDYFMNAREDQLAQFYGNWLHEGQYLDPVMRDIEAFLVSSQQQVTGEVHLQLYPYRFQVIGIESPYDLMSSKFGKYGEMNLGWSGDDVKGFSKIFGNQTMIYNQVKEEAQKG